VKCLILLLMWSHWFQWWWPLLLSVYLIVLMTDYWPLWYSSCSDMLCTCLKHLWPDQRNAKPVASYSVCVMKKWLYSLYLFSVKWQRLWSPISRNIIEAQWYSPSILTCDCYIVDDSVLKWWLWPSDVVWYILWYIYYSTVMMMTYSVLRILDVFSTVTIHSFDTNSLFVAFSLPIPVDVMCYLHCILIISLLFYSVWKYYCCYSILYSLFCYCCGVAIKQMILRKQWLAIG